MGRPADQTVARLLRRVESVGCADHETIDIGIIADEHQPVKWAGLNGDVCSASAGTISVEEISKTGRCVREADAARVGGRRSGRWQGRTEGKADDVVETI